MYERLLRRQYRHWAMELAIHHSDKPQELYNEFNNAADAVESQKKPAKVISRGELASLFGSIGLKPKIVKEEVK